MVLSVDTLLEPLLQFFWLIGDGSRLSGKGALLGSMKEKKLFCFDLGISVTPSWFSMTLKSHQAPP
jgi:hypothetical protein